jgi:glycosyltransferase involved in cell wall biosynthesis
MNILILNWRDIKNEWAGGGEVYIFELAKRWVKMGHKVNLFCGQGIYKKLPDEEKINGINVFRKGGKYSLYLWAVIFYFKKFRKNCDVIVDVQNGMPFFSTIYSRKPKVSVVYHIHDRQFFIEFPFPLSAIGYSIEKYLFPLFYFRTKIIAISKTTKDGLIKKGFSKKNINIVYCGISKKLHLRSNSVGKFAQPTIIYLGRIKKYKRVDLLIRIMPEILKVVPSAHLLIAGWGTEASAVTDMSMRSITRRKVKIIGPVSETEKKDLLSRSWVFVNPSIGEGWGISVIEANLYGTPAISFNVAGLSESIQNNKTGFLVKSEKELAKKICLLLGDGKKREYLGKNAKKWADSFSWDKAAQQSITLLESIRRKEKNV